MVKLSPSTTFKDLYQIRLFGLKREKESIANIKGTCIFTDFNLDTFMTRSMSVSKQKGDS
jgi:hypothetical protein